MKKALKILRILIVVLVGVIIATPVSLYIILSTSWAQNDIRKVAASELSALLATDVNIGKVEIHPFNRLSIYDISALDDYGDTALKIDEISVAFELFYLLRTGRLVIDFALIDTPEAKIYRADKQSPINIAKIIAGLKSERPDKRQSNYDLRVNTVVIRNGSMSYDVLDCPTKDSIFDINHIAVSDLYFNAYIPRISNEEYRVEIDRLCFNEKSGFSVKDIIAAADITPEEAILEYLTLHLPNSEIDFTPIELEYSSLAQFESAFRSVGIPVGIKAGSMVYLPDFAPFAPKLANLSDSVEIILDANISDKRASIERLTLSETAGDYLAVLSAEASEFNLGPDTRIDISELKLFANTSGIRSFCSMGSASQSMTNILKKLSSSDCFSADINAAGKISSMRFNASIALVDNALNISGQYDSRDSLRTINLMTRCIIDMPDVDAVLPVKDLTEVYASIDAKCRIAGKASNLELSIDSAAVTYRGHNYRNINLSAMASRSKLEAALAVADPDLSLTADIYGDITDKTKYIDSDITIEKASLNSLHLTEKYTGYDLSGSIGGAFSFSNIDDLDGSLHISDINFCVQDSVAPALHLDNLTIDLCPEGDTPGILLASDFFNGYLNGNYRLSTLVPSLKNMVFDVLPALDNRIDTSVCNEESLSGNNFSFDFKISECENFCNFFKLPVSIIHTVDLSGHLSEESRSASVSLDAPYLLQGDKIIESTAFRSRIDAFDNRATIYATTKMPTKKGPMVIVANMSGSTNCIESRIDWTIERKIPINGSFNFATIIQRDNEGLSTSVDFNPGTLTFGNEVWSINPSTIHIANKQIDIEHFSLDAKDKSIMIDGSIADDPDTSVKLALSNIALLDIFETLEIDKALIGGKASGTFTGKNLFSTEPSLSCSNLHVDDISYNRCILGDAEIAAFWDNDKKSFTLDADITGNDGLHSRIFGDIFPAGEALDINFDVKHTPVGFLKPFMEAFASDIKGYASGKARLFGTFKYIDMEGDIYADDLKIKIDFTNTWYSATDSIHLRPGLIDIKNITITDINGHTAKLNGIVKHQYFKEPSFNFAITDARDFLSYNVDSRLSPDWYGTIYGNGSASISGEPGVVNIGVNMSTAPKSSFTFVLSDRLDADEYSFITFTDKRAEARRDSLLAADDIPEAVRNLRSRLESQNTDAPSAYNMDLQIDITPDARMVLVMDPVSGDEIKAIGAGNLRLTYQSLNNDLKMYGTYTLDRGNYNFTLQDIIIKDFTIKEGSTIAFHGDPYSAQLAIEAIYSVNANLSDLDESFLLDKDLNRTNVPVHALLKVTGDMRQPDIAFDLEFPTLTQDTYRKVRSIVSTEEMMNRQIIYLLALNRFYTPDYMASTTKGNELFSVASSTISSQLSSMLGKLSEDWSIAPNLRSDRGDFSDVEVDVTLSSRLLNNRLLFNGNFGYRDKTLNTNQFVGDFDIEYLLNRKGAWRLKAYNRYNDQNYYVRTAQTTQGIGIVFKKDFNDFFGFLRPKKKTTETDDTSDSVKTNSSAIIIPDSIAHPQNPLLQ